MVRIRLIALSALAAACAASPRTAASSHHDDVPPPSPHSQRTLDPSLWPGLVSEIGVRGVRADSTAALSSDGRRVATASLGWVAVWNADTGELLRTFREREPVRTLRFSGDGATIYGAVGLDLVAWPVGAGRRTVALRLPDDCAPELGVLLPDDRTYVTLCGDDVTAWNLASRRRRHTPAGMQDNVRRLVPDPSGKTVAVVSGPIALDEILAHCDIHLIDVATWTIRHGFSTDVVPHLAFLPGGALLLDRDITDDHGRFQRTLDARLDRISDDGRAGLMVPIPTGNPHPTGPAPRPFVWRFDQPEPSPARGLLTYDFDILAISASGRVLQCGRSTCAVVMVR